MKDLSQGNVRSLITRFAMPMLLGNIFQQLYNVIDTVIVGKFIGKDALAAVGTSFPIIFMMISFIIGITMGFTIIISQFFGAKDMIKVKRAISTMYLFIFAASVVISIGGVLLSSSIFRLIDLPEQVIPQASLFLSIYFSGMIFLFGYNGTSAILRGLGDSKTPLYFLIGSVIINIGLDLLFVLVFHWGVAGVASATVISQAFAFFAQIIYLNKYHSFLKFRISELWFDRHIFRQGIRIGLPTGFQQTFVAAGMLALYWIVNQFGVTANAAYSAAARIDSFAAMPAMSFSAALSTFVGQNLGANRPDRVKKGLKVTLLMTAAISLIISCIAVFLGKYLMMLFSSDPGVIELGTTYLTIIGATYILFSSMFVFHGVLRGAGDTFIPMIITLLALWVFRVPIAYWLSSYPSIGINGVFWSIPIGWFAGLSLAFIYYLTGRWKRKAVVKYDAGGQRLDS